MYLPWYRKTKERLRGKIKWEDRYKARWKEAAKKSGIVRKEND